MRPLTFAVTALVVLAAAASASAAPYGEGPCAHLNMKLEKTIFAVDALTVDLWVDGETAREIRQISARDLPEDRTDEAIAGAVMDAGAVAVDIRFLRDVDLDRFFDAVGESLEDAQRAGMISQRTRTQVTASLPRWFEVVAERGFEDGDRLSYRVRGNTVTTSLVSPDGQVLLEQVDRGAERRRATLGGYLAPGTDFREPLLDSVRDCAAR
jgi:hypothetical protein